MQRGSVLLFSTLGTNDRVWEPLRRTGCLDDWDVRSWVVPGHGDSTPVLNQWSLQTVGAEIRSIAATCRQPVVACGIGLGAAGALYAMGEEGQCFAGMILFSVASSMPAEPWLLRASAVRAHGVGVYAADVVRRWLSPAGVAAPDLRPALLDMLQSIPTEAYAAACDATAGLDAASFLKASGSRLMVVAGQFDVATTPESQRALAAEAGAGFAVVDASAHLAPFENPTACAPLVAATLRQVHDRNLGKG